MFELSRLLIIRRLAVARWRVRRLSPSVRGLLWAAGSGLAFVLLNAITRELTIQTDPLQTQFLRYVMGCLVLMPFVLRQGRTAWQPRSISGQFLRGGLHTVGLCMWFLAIPHISLANTTAISFTAPIFVMLGAVLFLGESLRPSRLVAAMIGLVGVFIVVAPQLTDKGGIYLLLMLATSPLFAATSLMTKAMTQYERSSVIVLWQSLTVTAFSLPLALLNWQWPSLFQWLLFLVCGAVGTIGHFCVTRALKLTDVSATQTVKFLDLVWASALGWLLFGDLLSQWTVVGALVILASTVWITRHESRR